MQVRPWLLLLVLACCAHPAPSEPRESAPAAVAEAAPVAPRGRSRLGDRPIVCSGDGAWAVISPHFAQVTYLQNGMFIGTSDCGGTRRAIYSIECARSEAFELQFAGIPGPPLLGGKSAQLRLRDGTSKLLDCHEQVAPAPERPGDQVVCVGERTAVVLDLGERYAEAFYENSPLGTVQCVATAGANYRLTCTHPNFTLRFAGTPGPRALDGRSAELTRPVAPPQLLECFAERPVPLPPAPERPRPSAGPKSQGPRVTGGPARGGSCQSGQAPCGKWCCGTGERCCNAGPGPICVSGPSVWSDDGGALHLDACHTALY